jgi:hypothetical protein
MESVRARLEGHPPTFVPAMPAQSLDHETPGTSTPATVDGYLRKDSYTQIGQLRVPIFLFDVSGANWNNVYPSITFEILDIHPRFDESAIFQSASYLGDMWQTPIPESIGEVIDNDGTRMGWFPRMESRRAVEHPLNILFETRVYAKDPILSALLVQYIYDVFPPRHFIRVPQKDGTYRDWDLLWQAYSDLDRRQAVRSDTPGVEREYAKVITYRVEGYFDNTDTAELVNLVQGRSIRTRSMDGKSGP